MKTQKHSNDYLVERSEPVFTVELYLPKRAAFQGKLFECLTETMRDPQIVRDHFSNAPMEVLMGYLQNCAGSHTKRKDIVQAQAKARLFFGFSMYEVDGAFCNSRHTHIAEERVQVIRLHFPYRDSRKPAAMSQQNQKTEEHWWDRHYLLTQYFRSAAISVSQFERKERSLDTHEKSVLAKLDTWMNNVWVFVHGYILYKICECVNDVAKRHQEMKWRNVPPLEQDEVWMMSHWVFQVTRAIPRRKIKVGHATKIPSVKKS